jgi:hypothetical protein
VHPSRFWILLHAEVSKEKGQRKVETELSNRAVPEADEFSRTKDDEAISAVAVDYVRKTIAAG